MEKMTSTHSKEIADRANRKIRARAALYGNGFDFSRTLIFLPLLGMPLLGLWLQSMSIPISVILISELSFVGVSMNFIQSFRLRRQLRAAIQLIKLIDEEV